MMPILHHSDFADLVDERFVLVVEGKEEPVEAELIEAKEVPELATPAVERTPFVLQFRLPPGSGLGQGLFQIRHQKFEEFPIFMVPIAADENGWYMEACFN